jgi:hypothetical protein
MGEANYPSVAHVGYDISPLSWVEKYRNPRATEGESIFIYHRDVVSSVISTLKQRLYITTTLFQTLFG